LSTPTFLRSYARRIPRDAFGTLRLAVAGAERLSGELLALLENPFTLRLFAEAARSEDVEARRADDYAGGLNAAVDQLAALIRGEGLPAPDPRNSDHWDRGETYKSALVVMFMAVFLVGPFVLRTLGRKVGTLVAASGAALGSRG
jgi:uncharacterized protein